MTIFKFGTSGGDKLSKTSARQVRSLPMANGRGNLLVGKRAASIRSISNGIRIATHFVHWEEYLGMVELIKIPSVGEHET